MTFQFTGMKIIKTSYLSLHDTAALGGLSPTMTVIRSTPDVHFINTYTPSIATQHLHIIFLNLVKNSRAGYFCKKRNIFQTKKISVWLDYHKLC